MRLTFTIPISLLTGGMAALLVIGAAVGASSGYKPMDMNPACKYGRPAGAYETKDLPAQFKEFVPFIKANERLWQVACMTVPGRQGVQYLLATKATMKVGSVSILIRDSNKSLRLEAVNHSVVQIEGVEGSGASGGFGYIRSSRPGFFTIQNSFGDSVKRTDYEFNFEYSPVSNIWLLDSVVTQVFTRDIDLKTEKETDDTRAEKQTAKDFGRVTFSEFAGTKYGIVDYSNSDDR